MCAGDALDDGQAEADPGVVYSRPRGAPQKRLGQRGDERWREPLTGVRIRTQFLTESILLAVIGGLVGVLAGVATTAVYASAKGWDIVVPTQAWGGGIASAIVIGALAGLAPAVRASRLSPTAALRTA